MNTKFIPLLILMLLPTLFFAQKTANKKGNEDDIDIVVEYEPDAAIAVSAIPAAIILKTFEAEFNEKQGFVELRWKSNNILGAFTIEHSTDGEEYNEIGISDGASGFEKDYFIFEAREFDSMFNFYRLKQVINGKIIYSSVLNVSFSANNDTHVLELEDLGDKRKVMLRVEDEQRVSMKLINSEGEIVKELLNQELDINEIIFRTIDKGNFEPGNYFLLIEGKLFKQSKKIRLP